MTAAYERLEEIFERTYALSGAASMLHWDASTMMPSGSAEVRGEQLAILAELTHEMITAKELSGLLDEAEQNKAKLDDWQRANLREMRHQWLHENAVDSKLVGELTRAGSASEMCWRSARAENNFAAFAPHLEKVLALVREMAQAKAEAIGCTPYDALIDSYDPGTRAQEIDIWFDDLVTFLPGFTQQVMEHQAQKPAAVALPGPFPVERQRSLGLQFMTALGFDFTQGRLDESLHPFCGGVPGDVRLTTRYMPENFTESMFGVLHETGHALYEMGLPESWRHQPAGQARGMAMHESQSLFMEKQICKSLDFLTYAAPLIRGAFDGKGPAWDAQNLYRLVTKVEPSLIRVSADEVTYPSHVILRYRLEKALIGGSLKVADLPEAWRTGMKELLGLEPDSDTHGCMQDIHWADGTFGYFPTYTMGAMIAAQLFDAVKKAIPDVDAKLQKGEFAPVTQWLCENVHALGSKLSSSEIIQAATGKPLDVGIYKAHLSARYLS